MSPAPPVLPVRVGAHLEGGAGAGGGLGDGVAVVDIVRQHRALLRLGQRRHRQIGIFGSQVDVGAVPKSLDGVSCERERFRKGRE